jgi:hypothetical protein
VLEIGDESHRIVADIGQSWKRPRFIMDCSARVIIIIIIIKIIIILIIISKEVKLSP